MVSLMKVHLRGGSGSVNMYTLATLRNLCRIAGIELVERQEEATALWVSVSDPDDLPMLQKARRESNGRPVIMGGFEGYTGVPYLAWADAVVVGEGWEFISTWGKSPDCALNLPCVLTDERPGAREGDGITWRARDAGTSASSA